MATNLSLIAQYMEQGLYSKAIDLLKVELSRQPEDGHLHHLLAVNLLSVNRLAAAEHESREALRCDPLHGPAHRVLGRVLTRRRRYPQARLALEEALNLDPRDPIFHEAMGSYHIALDEMIAAEACFNEARDLDPSRDSPWGALASLAIRRRDLDIAEFNIERALALKAEDVDHLTNLATIRYYQGRNADARDVVLGALRISPEDPDARRLLCWLKARENWFLAPGWHLSAFVNRLGKRYRIPSLIGLWLVVRLIRLVLEDLGFAGFAESLGYLWLIFCIYTWISPYLFERMLAREVAEVRLDDKY